MGLASARRFQAIGDAPILHPLDAFEREGRAGAIPDEALPSRLEDTGAEAFDAMVVELVHGRAGGRVAGVLGLR
jgi:hypothetical protein